MASSSAASSSDSEGEELPALQSIWDDDHIEKSATNSWTCGWCGGTFKPIHASRAKSHVCKIVAKTGIAPCKATIPEKYAQRYKALWERDESKRAASSNTHMRKATETAKRQVASTTALEAKRSKTRVNGSGSGNLMSRFSTPTYDLESWRQGEREVNRPKGSGGQMSINASVQNNKKQSDVRGSWNARAEMAIADFFHSDGVAFSLVESPRFLQMCQALRYVADDFKVPNRRKLGGELLDINFETCHKANVEVLMKEGFTFGVIWLGDGATINRLALINVLGISSGKAPVIVAIDDCSDHMAEGGKKDAGYISEIFMKRIKDIDSTGNCTDLFFFDGASNVQKAGEILKAYYPRAYSLHGGEHVISLFFSDIAQIEPIKALILKTCRLYNVFGSGASHAIYAQFIFQSSLANKGRKVGLLRGASTRFASFFYAMLRLIRMKRPLLCTINDEKFRTLKLGDRERLAVIDLNDDTFWKALYTLCRAVFPAIRALRACDSNEPFMNRIYLLTYRTRQAIENSAKSFDDEGLFGSFTLEGLDKEQSEVYEEDSGDDNSVAGGLFDSDSEEDSDEVENSTSLSAIVLKSWTRREQRLEHDISITAWALSVCPDVWNDAKAYPEGRLTAHHRSAIERYIETLFQHPCPFAMERTDNTDMSAIKTTFWQEFKQFRNKDPPFDKQHWWNSPVIDQGRCYLWHEMFSLPYTDVLGVAACRSTSKVLGIGAAERAWKAAKHIKNARSAIGGDKLEKASILYHTARVNDARIEREEKQAVDGTVENYFNDDDLNFDAQLANFGVNVDELKEPANVRTFRGWIEDWEAPLLLTNDSVAEAKLLAKYRGLRFLLPDDGVTYTIHGDNLEFQRGSRLQKIDRGWNVFGIPPDSTDDEDIEPFYINDLLCELIADTKQAAGVEVIKQAKEGPPDGSSSDGSSSDADD